MTSIGAARRIADAVLFEGYLLYPYRASATKNQFRWQFGVLTPVGYASEHAERSFFQADLFLEADLTTTFELEARMLHVGQRRGDGWEVGEELRFEARHCVSDLFGEGVSVPILAQGRETGDVSFAPLAGRLCCSALLLEGPYGLVRVRVRLENDALLEQASPARATAIARSFVGAHLLVTTSGRFLSHLEPPEWAAAAVRTAENSGCLPVLVGGADRRTMLVSPILLYDYPAVAPESESDFFDGTEIDELLMLRTHALTEEERRAARETDPRASELIDRTAELDQALMERLHGTMRYFEHMTQAATPGAGDAAALDAMSAAFEPSGELEFLVVGDTAVHAGSRVRLTPPRRGRDAQDQFLAGRTAVVRRLLEDVDGCRYLGVVLEDDPGNDLYDWQGRYRYFSPEEVEIL